MKKLLIVPILLSFLFVASCQKPPINGEPPSASTFHQSARDAVVFAYGFINDLQTRHTAECQAAPTKTVCGIITKGVSGQRLAATTLNAYCAGPPVAGNQPYNQGGPCSAQAGYQGRLESALADLSSIMTDIKKLN